MRAQRRHWDNIVYAAVLSLLLTGCPSPKPPPPPLAPTLTWTGNGNPGVPVCSATVTAWCLTGYRLTDSKGLSAPLPLTQKQYTPTDRTVYQLYVTARDGAGNPVSSPPAATTIQ